MPSFVVAAKCKNNGKCEEICPSDIMRVDKELQKGYNIEPDMCWECLSCVKACPEKACEIRPYADVAPLGAEIKADRDETRNSIKWEIKYRDQSIQKSFEFAIRTTPWGAIRLPEPTDDKNNKIDGEELSEEPERLMTGKPLPTRKSGIKGIGGE
ncbi:MAG: adenylyl-sulfate reductase subunit beta [Thermoplasmataceae archaeon]